jgi:hypothetical protein
MFILQDSQCNDHVLPFGTEYRDRHSGDDGIVIAENIYQHYEDGLTQKPPRNYEVIPPF